MPRRTAPLRNLPAAGRPETRDTRHAGNVGAMRHVRFLLLGLLVLGLLASGARPAAANPGTTERVSVDSGGNHADSSSILPSFSADGRQRGGSVRRASAIAALDASVL